VEQALRAGLERAGTTSLKSAYFAAFRRTTITPDWIAYLERVWRRRETIPNLAFGETDEIAMAQELAIRQVPSAPAILAAQSKRIANPDRAARFAFSLPALSTDEGVRDAFFEGLARLENRRHEPWVLDALAFLNHPLRRRHAERYVEPALALLPEIRRTGDIFFPLRWAETVLQGHNSTAAAATVRAFLDQHADLAPRLRQVIEQTSDPLRRASSIVH
jgi:aminopeptidase N